MTTTRGRLSGAALLPGRDWNGRAFYEPLPRPGVSSSELNKDHVFRQVSAPAGSRDAPRLTSAPCAQEGPCSLHPSEGVFSLPGRRHRRPSGRGSCIGAGIARPGTTGFPLAISRSMSWALSMMGVFVLLLGAGPCPPSDPFVLTGLLGGFITFSAFSLETITPLWGRGASPESAALLCGPVGDPVRGRRLRWSTGWQGAFI